MNADNGRFITRSPKELTLRILVVDDDHNTREILSEALGILGAETRTAGSVAEARAILVGWHADMLISDLGMPEEDGYDFIREVRDHPVDGERRVPAIALTGYTRIQDRQRALLAGYNEVLTKPAELDTLLDAIRRLASGPARA